MHFRRQSGIHFRAGKRIRRNRISNTIILTTTKQNNNTISILKSPNRINGGISKNLTLGKSKQRTKMNKKILSSWDWLFMGFVAVYAFCIIYKSAMPLISGDDISFYISLRDGNDAWHGLGFDYKRFFPLAGWNLNFIALFSTSPYAFMIGNALVFGITAMSFYALARSFGVALCTLSFIALALSVGYVKIITQIPFPETTQIMFLLLFLLCAKKFYSFANSLDSTQRNSSYIYIYIYIRLSLTYLCKLRYLPQRSLFYFN